MKILLKNIAKNEDLHHSLDYKYAIYKRTRITSGGMKLIDFSYGARNSGEMFQ